MIASNAPRWRYNTASRLICCLSLLLAAYATSSACSSEGDDPKPPPTVLATATLSVDPVATVLAGLELALSDLSFPDLALRGNSFQAGEIQPSDLPGLLVPAPAVSGMFTEEQPVDGRARYVIVEAVYVQSPNEAEEIMRSADAESFTALVAGRGQRIAAIEHTDLGPSPPDQARAYSFHITYEGGRIRELDAKLMIARYKEFIVLMVSAGQDGLMPFNPILPVVTTLNAIRDGIGASPFCAPSSPDPTGECND